MIITGIQPTGNLHIGNYLGAIKPLIALQQNDEDTYAFIADYHAITANFDPASFSQVSRDLVAMILACDFDTERGSIFLQSDVPEHTEMAHILGCTAARVGQLNRMIQFKEKMAALAENEETPSVGLYTYPVLQAADVLLYQDAENGTPTKVPVGDDQSQHLNLVVDIAASFNHRFGDTFILPKPVISTAPRIMSLFDGTKKMSKSDPDDMNRINMSDPADRIVKKFRKATTDQHMICGTVEEIGDRVCLRNLLTIYAAFADMTLDEAVAHFAGKGFGALKGELADIVVATLEPIQARYLDIRERKQAMSQMLGRGAMGASIMASDTLHRVRKAIGIADRNGLGEDEV
jgi:tryptophanyl-tRNA synthetase